MKYIDINWLHKNEEYPYRLVSEINEEQFEVRKMEFYRNNETGFATESNNYRGTKLGITVVPSIEEITSSPEFEGKEISKNEFENLWVIHAISRS